MNPDDPLPPSKPGTIVRLDQHFLKTVHSQETVPFRIIGCADHQRLFGSFHNTNITNLPPPLFAGRGVVLPLRRLLYNVPQCILYLSITETETTLQQTAGIYPAALEDQLGFHTDHDSAHLQHPVKSRQPEFMTRDLSERSHKSRIGNGIGSSQVVYAIRFRMIHNTIQWQHIHRGYAPS